MITAIGHVAFRISDLDRSLDFYCGRLGFEEAFRLERDGEVSPWIVYLQLAPGQFIELFPGGEGTEAPARSRRTGYNHFCLVVDDLPATLAELRSRGLAVEGEPKQGMDGNWQYWIDDPDGNAVELMQIAAGSPQAKAERDWAAR
ncbi:MAG TPA: VOC family protein [Candidatus Dormibacteraeota bacterium]|jgi:lactoylglutathione lyase|nr:VOC family protein [Candidatus Dormibacteraeota bacterium]